MKLKIVYSVALILFLLYFPQKVKADFLITYGETVKFEGDLTKKTRIKTKSRI